MNGKVFSLAALLVLLTFSIATLVSMNGASLAQGSKEMPWCNAYAPILPHQSEPGFQKVKIKYGRSTDSEELNLAGALRWWAGYVLDPSGARKKEVMHFVPVSALNDDALKEVIAAASKDGYEKPYVAMALRPDTLKSSGVDLSRETSGFVTAPIWWNSGIEGAFNNALASIETDPVAAKLSIAKMAAYTVSSGMSYDPKPDLCNPSHEPFQTWKAIDVPFENLDHVYIGVSGAPRLMSVKDGAVVKILMGKDAWPIRDD